MSGTHRARFFWFKSRCFASKNHRWGVGPIETSDSDARPAYLHARNHRWGLGPPESCNSSPKVAVVQAQNHRWRLEHTETWYSCSKHAVMSAQYHTLGLWPIQTCRSGPKVAVLHAKTSSEVCDPQILVIMVLKSLFCMQKPQVRSLTHRDF